MPSPVISVAQMRDWEKATWGQGTTETQVIGQVGEILARRVRELVRPGDTVLILAGKGHNGDDAIRAGERLSDARVCVCNVTDPAAGLLELTRLAARRPALIVDGLFGIGLNRPLDGDWVALIQGVNELNIPILSVDMPSGLDATTGEPMGAAIKARLTLTLGAPKEGLLLPAAWPYVGRLEVAPEIGLVSRPISGDLQWTLATDFDRYPPARMAAGYKGTYGRLAILAGSFGYHGAAVLAARGAQAAQPGLITLYTQEPVYPVVASQLQAVMVNIWNADIKLPGEHQAVLLGPGLAAEDLTDSVKMHVRHIWRDSPSPVIVDANALDWLSGSPRSKDVVRIITPHPGEAGRLLRKSAEQVQANRPESLREISRRLGNCVVVLKGHQTLVGRSTGEIFVNSSGNPHLGQGGSGDVLAGYLAGLVAQPDLQADPVLTARYAVWQHGAAADRLNRIRRNWVVEDLAREIGNDLPPGRTVVVDHAG